VKLKRISTPHLRLAYYEFGGVALNERQLWILRELAGDRTVKEVRVALGISRNRPGPMLLDMKFKTGMTTLQGLAAWAVRNGIDKVEFEEPKRGEQQR